MSNIVLVRDVGFLPDSSPATILAAVARLNPDFDSSQITLSSKYFLRRDGSYSIRVRARWGVGTSYYGSVYVFFTCKL